MNLKIKKWFTFLECPLRGVTEVEIWAFSGRGEDHPGPLQILTSGSIEVIPKENYMTAGFRLY